MKGISMKIKLNKFKLNNSISKIFIFIDRINLYGFLSW